MIKRASLGVLCCLLTVSGCRNHAGSLSPRATVANADSSNVDSDDGMDLEPGSRIRIVVPQFRSGGFVIKTAQEGKNGAMTVDDLIGYQTSHYLVKDKGRNGVRLQFISSETAINGKLTKSPVEPTLPFNLPRRTGHIRIVYLVRVSQADHAMAIIESKRPEVLQSFALDLKRTPEICGHSGEVFCSWVPLGVALRPENDAAAASERSFLEDFRPWLLDFKSQLFRKLAF